MARSDDPAPDVQSFSSPSRDSGVQIASDWSSEQPRHLLNPSSTTVTAHDEADVDDFADVDNADRFDDNDSAFDDGPSLEDDTFTLNSSIRAYRIENGRSYHAYREGAYWGPNDEKAQDILDMAHHMYLLTLSNKLHLAPLKDPQRILDVGTGTGIWAMDFADAHPQAEVIGVDLSPIQPTDVPPNLSFIIDDIEETWHYRSPFDLIHSRMMVASLADWPKFFAASFANLRPGGWLECQDVWTLKCDDDTFTLDPPSCSLARWWSLICEAMEKIGRPMVAAPLHKRGMIDAGFVDVTDETYKWPINTWPKDEKMKLMGLWSRENTVEALESLALAPLTRILGWEKEEVQVLVAQARKDVMNRDIHAYWSIRFVYGRKPE